MNRSWLRSLFIGALGASIVATLAAAVFVAPKPSFGAAEPSEKTSEAREVSGFNRVSLNGAFRATIVANNSKTSVVLEASRYALDRIVTEVRDHTLFVRTKDGATGDTGASIKILLPDLYGIANDGVGSVTIEGLHGGDFSITNSGAAKIVASGRVGNESISNDGTGKIDTTAVEANDVSVDNNGVGQISVRAEGALTMNVNGIGNIGYLGSPTSVQSNVNGLGRINKL